jgi:Na+/H+ antiporter NhaC
MVGRTIMGASVAATLPAALAAAVLVSAPYAGTTTSPLSDHHATHRCGPAARHHHIGAVPLHARKAAGAHRCGRGR